ncbi:MAG: hypothetical protein PHT02_00315 [Tissierellia bacterium]|nr:hypothetical protein [Tissierellia bacterium]
MTVPAKGCNFKGCFHECVCPKNVGYIKESKFYCDYYLNDSMVLVKLGEKYLEKDTNIDK